MKVLVVDDNANDRKLLRYSLEKHGCEVREAPDGEAGLEMAGTFDPALIVSDGMMPKLDGFSFLHKLKKEPELQKIPFVFYSAIYTGSKDEALALALGAEAFIAKPMEPSQLWRELSAVLKKSKSADKRIQAEEIEAEEEYLKKYSDIVSSKLAEKVAELEQATIQLEKSEERYRRLLESLTDYIYTVQIVDGQQVRTTHGPGCMAVTGYTSEEYAADPELWYRMVDDEDRQTVIEQAAEMLSAKNPHPLEHRIIHKDGRVRWIKNTQVPRYDQQGVLVAYDGLVSDITERKELETQLRHAQKMEALGTLTGGIAHDFNNILTAIIGYTSLLGMKMESPYLDEILIAADRAANLTRSLLAFGRKQEMETKPVSINEIIRGVERMLSRLLREDIELNTVLAAGDRMILADPPQIEQVLMNLATNARDAMPKGGILTISTVAFEIDQEFRQINGYGVPGKYILIIFSDTGDGMSETTRQRIFEPFFTTKEVGKGTGLGLAVCYGIIKQHNGYIKCISEPGKGTTFRIYLPETKVTAKTRKSITCDSLPQGTETILLAEDDAQLRMLNKVMLETFGYRVIEALDGEDAITRFTEHKDEIRLVMLDVIMPKKNGKEAYEEILKIRPDIKALFTSGYPADVFHKKEIDEEGLVFISKPVVLSVLLKTIREILDKR